MSYNRPAGPKKRPATGPDAPRLWSEGGQRPSFDLRGFVRVSVLLSRRMARPLLRGSAQMLGDASGRMTENTLGPRLARACRLGRALPQREAVAQRLGALAGFVTLAAEIAVPSPVAVAKPAEPLLRGLDPMQMARRPRRSDTLVADSTADAATIPIPTPAPTPTLRPTDATGLDAATVAAIRAMIDDMRDVQPARPPIAPPRAAPAAVPPPATGRVLLTHGVPLTPPEPREPTVVERLSRRATRLAAVLLAGSVILLTLPVGIVRAALTHLRGEDLRTWS